MRQRLDIALRLESERESQIVNAFQLWSEAKAQQQYEAAWRHATAIYRRFPEAARERGIRIPFVVRVGIAGAQLLSPDSQVLAESGPEGNIVWWRDELRVTEDVTLRTAGYDDSEVDRLVIQDQPHTDIILSREVVATFEAIGPIEYSSLINDETLLVLSGRWVQSLVTSLV